MLSHGVELTTQLYFIYCDRIKTHQEPHSSSEEATQQGTWLGAGSLGSLTSEAVSEEQALWC